MTDNVIPIFGGIMHDQPPDIVLEKAKAWGMEKCLIIGENEAGDLLFGGTTSELKNMLWILSRALWFIQRSENDIMGTI